MEQNQQRSFTEGEMREMIGALVGELPALRALAGISQRDAAAMIGVSRQTYSAIENGKRQMTWTTFLALVLYFDANSLTQKPFREGQAYPRQVFESFNRDPARMDLPQSVEAETLRMLRALDDQGLHALKTVLMLEYARCTRQPGEAILRSFDGTDFRLTSDADRLRAQSALRNILRGKK